MTESKVRAEEQPQQEDLPQAVSTEAGSEEHTEVHHDFVKPAETEVKAQWTFANMSVREWLYEFCESTQWRVSQSSGISTLGVCNLRKDCSWEESSVYNWTKVLEEKEAAQNKEALPAREQ